MIVGVEQHDAFPRQAVFSGRLREALGKQAVKVSVECRARPLVLFTQRGFHRHGLWSPVSGYATLNLSRTRHRESGWGSRRAPQSRGKAMLYWPPMAEAKAADKIIHEILPVGLLQCNCSVVGDPHTREAIVIDPGDEVDRILEVVTRHNLKVRAILSTHAHIDHVGGLRKMKERSEERRVGKECRSRWSPYH